MPSRASLDGAHAGRGRGRVRRDRRPGRHAARDPLATAGRSGVIELKDTVKPGLAERFDEFRRMGIRTIMITGDNPLTAATIAREAGVDDFVAEAKPEDKIAIIRREQADGHLVAMTGDGTNDAPALAQADVGLAMNSGTSASKEAANMVDLDSDPTKLLEVIAIGKQLLITRGSITTFCIANDVAKYFAIVPALFVAVYPELDALNVMGLATPQSAILSAVIFNALIIVALIPLALRGVGFRPAPASDLLRRNLLIYGLGGIIAPFVGIKLIDVIVSRPRPRLGPTHMTTLRVHPALPRRSRCCSRSRSSSVRVYPAAVTVVAQVAFPSQANGSFITTTTAGPSARRLIGQAFERAERTSGADRRRRATATTATPRPAPTWGRRAPTLLERVAADVDAAARRARRRPGPGRPRDDLGVGPRPAHQPGRRPSTRSRGSPPPAGMAPDEVRAVVARHTEQPLLGFLGQPRGQRPASSTSTSTGCWRG